MVEPPYDVSPMRLHLAKTNIQVLRFATAPILPFSQQSVKFDDLCTNFQHHEELDSSSAVVTVTKTSTGTISGMTLSSSSSVGVIPITVPSTMITSNEVSLCGVAY